MPQVSIPEFEQLPLRVHEFLAGVPLHDVWAVDLPRTRPGITLDEFLRTAKAPRSALSPAATGPPDGAAFAPAGVGTGPPDGAAFAPAGVGKALLNVRLFVGGLLGWDREPAATAWETFATRLTPADRAKSLLPPGTRAGNFRVVYRFENEELRELINRTAHAAALSALVETANSYRFYFAVYVRNVSRITPLYMAMIDPFRKLIVYPSLLKSVRANWNQAFGAA